MNNDLYLNANEVAKLFYEVLKEKDFLNKFKAAIFAIIGKKNDKDKYKKFYDLFGTYTIE